MKTIIFAIFIATCLSEAQAADALIKVAPGSPKETFIIGAQSTLEGDKLKIAFTIQPRTTKPTLPFDCTLFVGGRTCGWRLESPCFDVLRKRATKEVISVTVQKSELKDAYFEFRYYIKSSDRSEIWRMQLADYENGVKPE